MFALPKAALPLFRSVAGACVLPTAKRFLTLMCGAILATGRRTITNLLRAVGGLAPGHPSSYHRVFSRRRWSLWPLAHGLADLILRHWVPEGSVALAGDDTVDEHRGAHVYGKGRHRDPVRSTHSYTAYRWGHKWVVLATRSASRSPTVPGPSPCWSRCIGAGSGISSIGDGTGPPLSCSAVWWPCSCTGSRTAISR